MLKELPRQLGGSYRSKGIVPEQFSEKITGKRSWLHIDLDTEKAGRKSRKINNLGAKRDPWRYEPGDDFIVPADPDDNLFCVVQKGDDHNNENCREEYRSIYRQPAGSNR